MSLKEPNSAAKTIPENSEAGSTCGRSTKLEVPLPGDYTHDLRRVGPANLMSADLGL